MSAESLKRCRKCRDLRPSDDFYLHEHKGKLYPAKVCNRCVKAYARDEARAVVMRRGLTKKPAERLTPGGMSGKERRAYWATYKAGKGCADCGETDWRVLEFDHLPEHEKAFTIAHAIKQTGYYSDEDIAAEIAKCEVVCRSCHWARTSQRARAPRARDIFQFPIGGER